MDERQAKRKASKALLDRFVRDLKLRAVDRLPAPVYGFEPKGWLLFAVGSDSNTLGGSEYVAVIRNRRRFVSSAGSETRLNLHHGVARFRLPTLFFSLGGRDWQS